MVKDGMVPFAQRISGHGAGEYAFPGGHLEFGESFAQCARREVMEETGMKVKNVRFQFISNLKKYGGKHYVHIGLIADWQSGVLQNLEPHKHGPWQWYKIGEFPLPMFETCRLAALSYKNGKSYFDN